MTREYIEKSTRYKILKRQNFCCVYCGKKLKYNINSPWDGEVAHIDHIKPVSKPDGSYLGRVDNLQALCPECNIKKGDKEQFYCFQCGRPLIKDVLIDGKEKEVIYICHHKHGCGTFFSQEQIEDKENWEWYHRNWMIPMLRFKRPQKKKEQRDTFFNAVEYFWRNGMSGVKWMGMKWDGVSWKRY